MKSQLYSIEDLKGMQEPIEDKHLNKLGFENNKLKALFPIDKEKLGKDKQQFWAFACSCGNYCVQDFNLVKTGKNKSCGCLMYNRNKFSTTLKAFKFSIKRDYKINKIGYDSRTRDWSLECLNCGVEKDNLTIYENLYMGRKFCKCSSNYKGDYNFVKDQILNHEPNTTWKVKDIPTTYTTKKDLRISLECKKCHHKVDMLFGNYIRNKGCQGCSDIALANRLSKNLSYFMEKSIEKHGDRYDYSKVVYKMCRDPVEIICEKHGEFWQSPDNHYNKGKGCPKCRNERLKYVSFHKNKVEENKVIYKELPSGVYVMSVGDYTKLGLSVNADKRSKEIKNKSKLPVDILHYRELDMYNAFKLEHSLHKHFKDFNPEKEVTFDGHTECFILDDNQIKEAIKIIDEWTVLE